VICAHPVILTRMAGSGITNEKTIPYASLASHIVFINAPSFPVVDLPSAQQNDVPTLYSVDPPSVSSPYTQFSITLFGTGITTADITVHVGSAPCTSLQPDSLDLTCTVGAVLPAGRHVILVENANEGRATLPFDVAGSGAVYAFGAGASGALGTGSTFSLSTPTPVVLPAGTVAAALALGSADSAFVSGTSKLYMCGTNNGAFGSGSTSLRKGSVDPSRWGAGERPGKRIHCFPRVARPTRVQTDNWRVERPTLAVLSLHSPELLSPQYAFA